MIFFFYILKDGERFIFSKPISVVNILLLILSVCSKSGKTPSLKERCDFRPESELKSGQQKTKQLVNK